VAEGDAQAALCPWPRAAEATDEGPAESHSGWDAESSATSWVGPSVTSAPVAVAGPAGPGAVALGTVQEEQGWQQVRLQHRKLPQVKRRVAGVGQPVQAQGGVVPLRHGSNRRTPSGVVLVVHHSHSRRAQSGECWPCTAVTITAGRSQVEECW